MKKLVYLILVCTLVISVAACSTNTTAPEETTDTNETTTTYTAGTYIGTANGHNGPVSVEVTLTETTIDDIKVTETSESPGIGDIASEKVINSVLTNQSLQMDIVTGCTISQNAFKQAITAALESAGADVDALKSKEITVSKIEDFSIDTEVVVIGSGAAGMMAAIEAAREGAKVVVLEKLARNGGATRISSGMLVVGGSKLQEEAGIEDSVEALKEYWVERGEGDIDQAMTDFVAENVNDSLEDLMSMGIDYNSNLILYSGTADVARAHMPSEAGREMMDDMVATAEGLGVEILYETPAVSLIQDETGAVVGVNATQSGANVTVNAKSVVIATGGYAWNKELLEKYSPNAADAWAVSSPGNTGDGLVMALDVGADSVFKGGYIGWKVVSPAYGHTTAVGGPIYGAANLVVNETGNRFVNENLDYPFMYEGMVEDGSDTFYFIFETTDGETTDLENNVSNTVANLELGVQAGVCFKADTLEELAELSNLTNLVATVEKYNNSIATGVDEEFNRDTTTMTAIKNGPFYALKSKKAILGTFGGINTNITGEVVNESEEVIPGLYAAGEVANGEFFPALYPASGSAISMSVVLGKEAGKSAAAYALK